MARFNNPLANVQVAAPCQADWNQMMGDERVRFCSECNLNVYNLSKMIRSEAENLIARNEGRLCVKFYRRWDGSIITQDCPVGLRAIRRRVSYVAKAVCSMLFGLLAGLGVHEAFSSIVPLFPRRTMGVMAERVEPPREIADIKDAPVLGRIPVPIADRRHQLSGRQKRTGASNR